MPVVSVVFGLITALVIPGLFDSHLKGKKRKRAFARLCQIIGFSIIIVAMINWLSSQIK